MEKQFRGRNKELNALEQKFNQNGFSMTVIFGRRRIGKTMLVNHFIQEKKCKCITFTSVEREERELLSMMTESVLDALAPELKGNINFTSFDKLFDFIGTQAERERIVFFIDEYPYLAKQCPYESSTGKPTI